VVVLVVGFGVFLRVAPSDPVRWHVDPVTVAPPSFPGAVLMRPGADRPGPVFVVGAPGAGLGLVSALFAGHPKVHSLGESEELDRLMERIPAQTGSAMPECVSDLATLAPDSLQRSYDSAVGVLPEGRPFTVDASAQNLLHVGLIDLFFRSARVVLVERDPADLALQMFRRPWTAPGAAFAGSMADIQTYLSGHDRLVALWKSRVRRRLSRRCRAASRTRPTGCRPPPARCGGAPWGWRPRASPATVPSTASPAPTAARYSEKRVATPAVCWRSPHPRCLAWARLIDYLVYSCPIPSLLLTASPSR
jgi:hypothetical protein